MGLLVVAFMGVVVRPMIVFVVGMCMAIPLVPLSMGVGVAVLMPVFV